MIDPPPASTIGGSTYFIPRNTPRKLIAITRSKASHVILPIRADSPSIPALLNATPGVPSCRIVLSTIRLASSSIDTSARIAIALPPPRSISEAVSSAAFSSISTAAIFAPSRANSIAVALPMPDPAPVIRAIFPSSFFMSLLLESGRGLGRGEGHRQMLDAGEQVRAQTLHRTSGSHVGHAPQERVEHDAQFDASQVRAETEMLAVPECDVIVGMALNVEPIRIAEDLFVAVARWIPDDDAVPLANPLATDFHLASRGAHDMRDRRGPTQDFFDRRPHQRRIAQQAFAIIRPPHQLVHSAGDRIAGGFLPAEYQEKAVEQHLDVAKAVAVDFAVHQGADEIGAGIGAAFAYKLHEIVEDLHLRPRAGFLRGPVDLVFRILVAQRHVAEREHQVPVLARHREHLADDRGRKLRGHLDHQVAATALDYPVDDLGGDSADVRFERSQRAWSEPPIHHLAHTSVARRIGRDHHLAEPELHPGRVGIRRVGEA